MAKLPRLVTLLCALGFAGCSRRADTEPSASERVEKTAPAASVPDSESPAPKTLYLPGEEEAEPARVARCPEDMAFVPPRLCVDRYEMHLVDRDTKTPLSPFFTPSAPATLREHWMLFQRVAEHRRGKLAHLPVPTPPEIQLSRDVAPQAMSAAGVLPQGYLSKKHAADACEQAGKRLCTRFEWLLACGGQRRAAFPYGEHYEEGACNVHRSTHPAVLLHGNASLHHRDPRLLATYDAEGPLLRLTGTSPRCASRWGEDAIYDMVGNIDEWVEDESGVFVGGFFSRGTKAGCLASIDVHGPEYLDYSLGGRCCRDYRSD